MHSSVLFRRCGALSAAVLLLLGASACTDGGRTDSDAEPASTAAASPRPSSSSAASPAPHTEPSVPAPGEAPEAGGVEAWAEETLGRESGTYYGHGWMGGAGMHTADAPVPAGSYGVTLACQGDGPVEVVLSEGEDAPEGAEPTSRSVECEAATTVAVQLETEGMQLEFTTPDGIHLYGYKIFERTG